MRSHTDITDPRVVKALAHPLRVHILGLLEERTLSPSEIADEIDAPLGNVSYHVRQLAQLGLIKLVRKTPRRGAIEHHYKAQTRPHVTDEAWGKLPEIVRQAMVGARLGQLSAEVNAAAGGGGFSRADAHLTRTPLKLDEQGFQELAAELLALLDKVDGIAAASDKRLAKTDDHEGIAATLVMMLFDSVERTAPAATVKRRRTSRSPRRRTRTTAGSSTG